MMIRTLHRPFLDPLHHQNTRSSPLGSWISLSVPAGHNTVSVGRERENTRDSRRVVWNLKTTIRSITRAKLEPRAIQMFTFRSTLGALWHSPFNYFLKIIKMKDTRSELSVQFSIKTVSGVCSA